MQISGAWHCFLATLISEKNHSEHNALVTERLISFTKPGAAFWKQMKPR